MSIGYAYCTDALLALKAPCEHNLTDPESFKLLTSASVVQFGYWLGLRASICVEQSNRWHLPRRNIPSFPCVVSLNIAAHFAYMLIISRPAAMIWPTQFANTTLFYALHDKSASDPSQTNGWSISRYRYFMYVMIGAFCWYW